MSQPMPPPGYAPQYSFWPYYSAPPQELLAPARRAGTLLLVVGVLILLFSGLGGTSVTQMPDDYFARMIAAQKSPEVAQLTPSMLRSVMKVMFVLIAAGGLIAILMGLLVRGGGRAAATIALVLLVLPTLGLAAMLVGSLGGGPAAAGMALLILGVPLILLGMTAVSLVAAIRVAPQIEQARLQQQMMLHQQQAAYYAQSYGDGQAPPPSQM